MRHFGGVRVEVAKVPRRPRLRRRQREAVIQPHGELKHHEHGDSPRIECAPAPASPPEEELAAAKVWQEAS